MSDVLAALTPQEVAGFYGRMADHVDKNKGAIQTSVAALLMRHYLNNRNPKAVINFDAPAHLIANAKVNETLKFHRAVYLTEQKGRFTGGGERWVGLIPRLQGKGYPKWNGMGAMNMEYQSLVELPVVWTQLNGTDADRDILYGLHGFQLKTNVSVTVQPVPNSTKLRVSFTSFQARVLDRYDWDYNEHLTVPNPDYNSKAPGAVTPQSDRVTVYHKNAKRLEDNGLAAPYDLETNPWAVTDVTITGPAEIDPNKKI